MQQQSDMINPTSFVSFQILLVCDDPLIIALAEDASSLRVCVPMLAFSSSAAVRPPRLSKLRLGFDGSSRASCVQLPSGVSAFNQRPRLLLLLSPSASPLWAFPRWNARSHFLSLHNTGTHGEMQSSQHFGETKVCAQHRCFTFVRGQTCPSM